MSKAISGSENMGSNSYSIIVESKKKISYHFIDKAEEVAKNEDW